MLRNWRAWVLGLLFFGPIAVYVGLGALWLHERHWGVIAFAVWTTAALIFGILSVRWTRDARPVLPPIDWDAPNTFSPEDRKAWDLVEQEAERAESLSSEQLTSADLYIDSGRRLVERLAAHYHPLAANPIEHVPVVELLTALELAAEDLNHIIREVPGGDLVTPAHWKKAVQAAGYFQKASDLYGYLLPFLQPVTGLMRLGTQKLMVQPAWKNMQQNLQRWFYKAYLNRLGTHLIELYSGRLSIGAEQYRRLTRKGRKQSQGASEGPGPLVIAVAGARDSGKTALLAAMQRLIAADLDPIRGRLEAAGFDGALAEQLRDAEWIEVSSYTVHPGAESARDRSTRRDATEEAVEADLLLLVIDGTRENLAPDVEFVTAWEQWFVLNPRLDTPPALSALTGIDRPEFVGTPQASGNGTAGSRASREPAIRARLDAARAALPPVIAEIVPVGLGIEPPEGLADRLLPALALLLHRAEQAALKRHLYRLSSRSKARRFVSQLGRQGRRVWSNLRRPRGELRRRVDRALARRLHRPTTILRGPIEAQ